VYERCTFSPEAQADLHWLRVRRDAMERSAFTAILNAQLEPEDVEALLGLLDHTPESDADEGT
jgi:hypothetical protein